MPEKLLATRAMLLRRSGLAFVEPAPEGRGAGEALVRGAELELGALGVVVAPRLRRVLTALSVDALAEWTRFAVDVTARRAGAHVKHVPLFRSFPDGVPTDTAALWWKKVLAFYCQGENQPCIHCGRAGTTHVLSPCGDVVCDHCFDGTSYSACPVCERHLDPGQPFIQPSPERPPPQEKVRFTRIDLGDDVAMSARALFSSFAARTQPMSPVDKEDLVALVKDLGATVLPWLPEAIPVKENRAHVFGALFGALDATRVVEVARPHLSTATDVLRLVAAMSGADPGLQGETVFRTLPHAKGGGVAGTVARWVGLAAGGTQGFVHVHRFRVLKMSRPLRRALLALLEGLHPDSLVEDVLRHRSYWVWVGEHLHPHDYAARFPNVARAFLVARGQDPDGHEAPPFETFAGRVERAMQRHDGALLAPLLAARPGELGRRLDHALRTSAGNPAGQRAVVDALVSRVDALPTPMLLTLRAHLPLRLRPQAVRVYWPRGTVNRGQQANDTRPPLTSDVVTACTGAITGTLLARFAAKPAFDTAIIDAALHDVIVPFNERTASRGAVPLPRGSRIAIPESKALRLFCHWCEPEVGGQATDIDLSVAFCDASWRHVGVCSYYSHEVSSAGRRVAASSGDIRDGPFPGGGSEFVDVDVAAAREAGFRYAVMIVNNYDGMPFGLLHRAFAGVMPRDDLGGAHFDPRTVALRFDLQGSNGVFLPLVVDLADGTLTWLDAYARGEFAYNNAAKSAKDYTRLCPSQMTYFRGGTRPSMADLARLHAAARCRRVLVRGSDGVSAFYRRDREAPAAFLARLEREPGAPATLDVDGPVLAALLHGDLALPAGSTAYALFREQVVNTVAAADLLA